MAFAQSIDDEHAPKEDHFVVLRGATWADYQRVLELRGDRSAPRVTFVEGALEILSPSRSHESIKSMIGRLVEVYCIERNVEFRALGSWTLEDASADRGVEPDESYVFREDAEPNAPDLAIEVIWTSGGLNKLDAYRKLGVREVWVWRRAKLTAWLLTDGTYMESPRSEALPGIDLAQLASFVDRPTTSAAIREYRAALQSKAT